MTKSALAISLAVLVSINAAAHSQSNVVANPVLEGTRASGDCPPQLSGHLCGCAKPECGAGASWDSPFGFNGHFCR